MKVPSAELADKQFKNFLALFEEKTVWTNQELIQRFNPWREIQYRFYLLSRARMHGISFRVDGWTKNGKIKLLVGKEEEIWPPAAV